jgi:hypothetical protein
LLSRRRVCGVASADVRRFGVDAFPFGKDLCGPAEVGIRQGHISQALVVALMIVLLDEGADLGLEVPGQEVVLQQDPFLQGLAPALDLALGFEGDRARRGRVSCPVFPAAPQGRRRCLSGN